MLKILKKKKGFTLIELIVVMAVIGILVLLAIPKFIGYTEKARATEIRNNIKQLENASERYYIDNQAWPKASEEPYTADEIESVAKEILNKTGQVVVLDPDGKYYDIDYEKLQKHVQKPKDNIRYILQNPIGEVFYVDKLPEKVKIPNQDNEPTNKKPIAVITLSPNQALTTNSKIVWSHENSSDPDGDNIINSEWDGTLTTYTTPGNYIVRLRVQDEKGLWSDWASTEITISNPPGNLDNFDLDNYSQVSYVDSVNGNDSNIGSDILPYKTIQKAINNTANNGIIYIKKGEYREYSKLNDSLASANMNVVNKNLTFVGENQNTRVITNISGISDTTRKHSLYMNNSNVKIYNMLFEFEGVNPGVMHWFGFLTTPNTLGTSSIEVYNSAFIAKSPNNHMHLTMTFQPFSKILFENTLMDLSQDSDLEGHYYISQTAFQLVNSALKENTLPNCATNWDRNAMNHTIKQFTNTVHNSFTYDPITYDITSDNSSQRGVYYGEHAWTR